MQLASFRRKNIQMLATLMATATYAAGFNPPGGVWQDTAGHLPGDPIMRSMQHHRYLVFFYFNAAAFALSLMVVVVTLVLANCPKKIGPLFDVPLLLLMVTATVAFIAAYGTGACRDKFRAIVYSLMVVALLPAFLQLFGQSGSENIEDDEKYLGKLIAPLSMFALTITYVGGLSTPGGFWDSAEGGHRPGDEILHGKLLRLFSWFNTEQFVSSLYGIFCVMCSGMHVRAVAFNMMFGLFGLIVAYTAGTSRGRRSTVGVICGLCAAIWVYVMIYVAVRRRFSKRQGNGGTGGTATDDGTPGALANGAAGAPSNGNAGTPADGTADAPHVGTAGAPADGTADAPHDGTAGTPADGTPDAPSNGNAGEDGTVGTLADGTPGAPSNGNAGEDGTAGTLADGTPGAPSNGNGSQDGTAGTPADGTPGAPSNGTASEDGTPGTLTNGTGSREQIEKRKERNAERQRRREASLVQLLAGLAVSITYLAGMYPPGGVWQNGDKAGDPILLTTNPGRYRAFFYCNSVAFVASLLAILLGQKRYWTEHHALQAAMILDLLALAFAYAIGSCRDQISSMYVLGIAAAAVVYVVIHVQYFTLGSGGVGTLTDEDAEKVDKKGGRFMLLAILVASITYQAGLTTPGGFLLQQSGAGAGGNRVGDPVLLHNYPRRYKAFFYCNSVSFMVSIVLLLLLVNPNMYRPAIRSRALSLCSAVSFACLIGAFAAGSTQHMKTSIHIFVVAGVAVILCLPVLVTVLYHYYWPRPEPPVQTEDKEREDRSLNKIYLMTLAILVGSVTYQAGLDPPGGSWQSTSGGHHAGHPVMHDKRRSRYLAFLWGNSTSFVASIYLIEILILTMFVPKSTGLKRLIEPMVVAQYIGFLLSYAAGSSRHWKTSLQVITLVTAVLAYVAIHVMLTICIKKKTQRSSNHSFQKQDQAQAQAQDSGVVNQKNIAEC